MRTTLPMACVMGLAMLGLAAPAANPAGAGREDGVCSTLLAALKAELARSFDALRNAEPDPLYYLGYEVHDTSRFYVAAALGALYAESRDQDRVLTVDARIGSPAFDNTHQIKGPAGFSDWPSVKRGDICRDGDEAAIRSEVWLLTDSAYKQARERYTKVKTNRSVTADEQDKSDDFSAATPVRAAEPARPMEPDAEAWKERVRRLSLVFKKHPFILASTVNMTADTENRYILNTEGTEIVAGRAHLVLSYSIGGRTDDGMDLHRHRSYHGDRESDIPDDAAIVLDMEQSAAELEALLKAPLVEPYCGPAIFKARAAGVYFHEIMGHRLEGHRQKLEAEGQTFTKKIGRPVTSTLLSVCDDPTMARWLDGRYLNGFYKYDDEGVPAQRVVLIENGVLRGFLMSRSPIEEFPLSNGHGRRSAGMPIVARQGNLIVSASKTVSREHLRDMLIAEIRRQNKPCGLVFEDVSGGFTSTRRGAGQSFQVTPLLVRRVFPDGRPDEVVRGVNIVGTPLASFTKIIAAGDDPDIFNGMCGAESGWVNVSAVSPSLLFSEIEVEKKQTASEKPPILPPPCHDQEAGK